MDMHVYFEVYDILHEKTMTEKQVAILEILQDNFDMSTKDIIMMISNLEYPVPSERLVQKIRKEINDIKTIIDSNEIIPPPLNMDYDRDVKIWDAYEKYLENLNRLMKGENDMQNGTGSMSSWQIDIINIANQSGWSIQQISERLQLDCDKVRETLTSFHYMIKTDVLDEESEDVYFNANKQDVPDTEVTGDIFAKDVTHKKSKAFEKDFWEVEIDCVDACSKANKSIDVFLSIKARSKAMKFMNWAKSREWLAYLIGEIKEDGYYIHDLHLPKQKTSATLVDDVIEADYNNLNIVGVIHSHHEMGAGDENNPSFSGHDTAFINSNHNLSLLAGRDHKTKGFKIVGIARTKTPCNSLIKVKAVVKLMKEEMSDEDKALQGEFMKKVFGNDKKIKDPFKGNTVLGNKVGNDGILDTRNGNYHFTSSK